MSLEIATQFYIKEIKCNSNYKTQNFKPDCSLIIDESVDGFEFIVGLTTSEGEFKITKESFRKTLIKKAKDLLGEPYKWGGDNPEIGFDSSGLVQYVYKNSTGLKIGRTVCDQLKKGNIIAKNKLQAGDVVFFGSEDIPHHVGIYLGEDDYVHVPKSGDVIKISKLSNRSDYITARRYF